MYSLALVSCPDVDTAATIGRTVVKERLAACATVIPGVESIYWWEEKVKESREALLLLKTRSSLFKRLEKVIAANHPYSVPEILSFKIEEGYTPYLKWIDKET